MATYTSHSPAETLALGEAWGRSVASGRVIALQGDLGAGKTELVKGIARGLGIATRVQSPTFALLNVYPGGRLPLHHIDLYRLDSRAEIVGAGLEEFLFSPEGVTVVEWPERWCHTDLGEEPRPAGWWWVHIEAPEEQIRTLTYGDTGP
ncbi:MAG TPA: tRNA (adenosine(37)-N6)-threonylcarbamoyltransferase complex ATPase subunit type 1 TsaE [Verrucomicrobiales bacterium]|nr:tRNA (adenosine(37)-N6)-threonylcarbamoyltransferase complex ATPase subunit type 1 TsaE [Verrucomicrobiales bacterium]